jgi:hypothetical protein
VEHALSCQPTAADYGIGGDLSLCHLMILMLAIVVVLMKQFWAMLC